MMEPDYKQQPPWWTATYSGFTEKSTVSPTCTALPSTATNRSSWAFRGRRLLTLLSLFLKVRDRRHELLDCSSLHEAASWINSIQLVAATSVFNRVVERSPERDEPLQFHEVMLSPPPQRAARSNSSYEMPAQSSLSESHPFRFASKTDFSLQGTLEGDQGETVSVASEERLFTTSGMNSRIVVSDPMATRVQKEYSGSALAKTTAHGVSGLAHFARATTDASGVRAASLTQGIDANPTAYGSESPGHVFYQKAYYRNLGRQEGPTAASSDVKADGHPRSQLHQQELHPPLRGNEVYSPSLAALYSSSVLLSSGLLMNASVTTGVVSQDGGGENFTNEKSGSVADNEPSHVSRAWLLGIFSCFIGAFCGSLGDNMVRRSFILLGEKDQISFFQMWRSPLWTIGMFLTVVVNTCCSIVGLAFAPATVVTSFAGVHIFWNTVLAKTLNREKATSYDYVGIVAVILGIVLIVLYSGKNQAIQSYEEFRDNLLNPGPIVYIFFVVTVVALGTVLECCPANLPSCEDAPESVGDERKRRARLTERFLLAATSGACGGLSNLLAKASILVLNAGFVDGSQISNTSSAWVGRDGYPHLRWGACVLVALTGAVAAAQLLFLNASLRKFEAIYVVPTINAVLIVMGALGGIVLFCEIPAQYTSFTLGVMSVVIGVIALSYGKYEAEQHLLPGKQREEIALRNISGREPCDPLLQQGRSPEASSDQLRQQDPYPNRIYQVQRWCETLFRPLTDASINILVRTNTLNTNYPAGLLNMAHLDSNANIRILHQSSSDMVRASKQAASGQMSPTTPTRQEQDEGVIREDEGAVAVAGTQ